MLTENTCVTMNKPLVVSKYFVAGLLLYDVFIDISWLFHPQDHKYLPFCYDCLICSCSTFSPLFCFPNLVKTDLFYILLQNYMRRDELVLIGHIKQSVPQFTSGSCNCGNHLVIISSFTTTQNKIFFSKHWPEAHLTFYFSLYIYISIYCPESFIQDFPYPVTPKSD